MYFNVDFLEYFVSVNRRFFCPDLTYPNTITMFRNDTGDTHKVDKSLQMKQILSHLFVPFGHVIIMEKLILM